MRYISRIVAGLFLVLANTNLAWADDSQPEKTAKQRLLETLAPGWVLTSGADSRASKFQFEAQVIVERTDKKLKRRSFVVERNGSESAFLQTFDDTLSVAHLSGGTLCLLSRDAPGHFLTMPARFNLEFGASQFHGSAGIPLKLSSYKNQNKIRLDIRGYLIELLAHRDLPITYNALQMQFRIGRPGKTALTLRLRRELGPNQYPYSFFSQMNPSGEGIVITNIHEGYEPDRSILTQTPAAAGDQLPTVERNKIGFGDPAVIAMEFIKGANASGVIEDDERFSNAATLLSNRFPVTNPMPDTMRQELVKHAGILTEKMGEDEGIERRRAALQAIVLLLQKPVIERAQMAQGKLQIGFVIAYERARAANLFRLTAGHEASQQVYDGLLAVISDRSADNEENVCQALDLLGQIGVPIELDLLSQVDDALAEHPSPSVALTLSSMRVRLRTATDDDIPPLKRALLDKTIAPIIKHRCLESLFLVDELHGLHDVVFAALDVSRQTAETRWLNGVTEAPLLHRLTFTAANSAVGRSALLARAQNPDKRDSLHATLQIIEFTLKPADPLWSDWMQVAKKAALDESFSILCRSVAARIASQDKADDQFQHAYIASALASEQALLVLSLFPNYVRSAANAHEHGHELLACLNSQDMFTQLAAGELYYKAAMSGIPPVYDEQGRRILLKMLQHDSSAFHVLAVRVLDSIKKADHSLDLTEFCPLVLHAAQNEPHPTRFTSLLLVLTTISNDRLQFDVSPGEQNYFRDKAEAVQWIAKNRKKFERQAAAWIANESKPLLR